MRRTRSVALCAVFAGAATAFAASGDFDPGFSPALPARTDTSALLARPDGSLAVGRRTMALVSRTGAVRRSSLTGDEVALTRRGALLAIRESKSGVDVRTAAWRLQLPNLSSPRLARADGQGGVFFLATRGPGAAPAVVHVTARGAHETVWFDKRSPEAPIRYARDLVVGERSLTFLSSSSRLADDQILRLTRRGPSLQWRAPADGAIALAPDGAAGVMAVWRQEGVWGVAHYGAKGRVVHEEAFASAFEPAAVVRDAQGRYVIAGHEGRRCAVARLRPDGRLDARFGRDGYAWRRSAGTCRLRSITATPDGYVAGGRSDRPFLARLAP